MIFLSDFITTKDFCDLPKLNVYHAETERGEMPPTNITNYHAIFQKVFSLERVARPTLYISADDCARVYINGRLLGDFGSPSYHFNYNYYAVDISEYLMPGENIISVHAYYLGLISRSLSSGDNRFGFIADIFDGDKYILGTDQSWHYSVCNEFSGEVTGYNTQFLENIDFKKAKRDFSENAIALKNTDYTFRKETSSAVISYLVKPNSVKRTDNGYFLDFGGEITGSLAFTVKGRRGSVITVRYGEETENGAVKSKLRCNCEYVENIRLSGETDEVEFFAYKAFRYASVEGCDPRSDIDFYARVRHCKFNAQIALNSELSHLTDIWKMCERTARYSVQEVYTDCPTREKGQYLGDFLVSGLSHLYLSGNEEMYKKALRDFADSTKISDGMMSVAPGSTMQEIADYSLLYPRILLSFYRYSHDAAILSELLPAAESIMRHYGRYARHDGLLDMVCEWNLVDWPMNLRDGYTALPEDRNERAPAHNVLNAYYIGAMHDMNTIKKILGGSESDTSSIENAYISAFYDDSKGLFCDGEDKRHSALHSNVLPLLFGIAPKDSHEKIHDFIMGKGLSCGVWFSYFVLKALGSIGAKSDELALILNEGEHSWVNMLREGATTCFEAWGLSQKWNTSLCHPWASAPVIAIIEDILGIDPYDLKTKRLPVYECDKIHLLVKKSER